MEEDRPEEEDIYLGHTGPLGGMIFAAYCGKIIAQSPDRLSVEETVKTWMDEESYWPNVWYVSDHGNVSLITDLGR